MPKGVYPRKKRHYRAHAVKRSPFASRDALIRSLREQVVKGRAFELFYRPHEYGVGHNRVRVWRTDWPGDCFEILSPKEFDCLTTVCQKFNISLLQADDED